MTSPLRSKLIRLAMVNTELRLHLLPILKRAYEDALSDQRGQGTFPVNQIDHGYEQSLAGGTDVMKRLQDQLLIEQGRSPREHNPRLAAVTPVAVFKKLLTPAIWNLAGEVSVTLDRDAGKAASFAVAVLIDVNYGDGKFLPETVTGKSADLALDEISMVDDVSRRLGYNVDDAALFAVALIQRSGSRADAMRLMERFINTTPENFIA